MPATDDLPIGMVCEDDSRVEGGEIAHRDPMCLITHFTGRVEVAQDAPSEQLAQHCNESSPPVCRVTVPQLEYRAEKVPRIDIGGST